MTWPLKEDFNKNGPITQIPLDWFETVSKILNYMTGVNVQIDKSAAPSEANPWKFIVDLSQEGVEGVPPHNASTDGYALVSNGLSAPTWQLLADVLPTQTGNNGKYLTTDGSSASWADLTGTLPDQTGNNGKYLTTDGSDASWIDFPIADGTVTGQLLNWNNTSGAWEAFACGSAQVYGWLNGEGTAGQVLMSNGAGSDPSFETIDTVETLLEGQGTGFVFWNDTINFLGTIYYLDTSYIIASGASSDARRVVYFNSGTDITAQLKTIDKLIGDIPSGGTKAVDQVLTLKSSAGTYYASWENASTGLPTGGSTSMVLQKASATNYDIEWDWVRSV